MKTPYDEAEARKMVNAAEKRARAAIKKLAGGNESYLQKARKARDQVGELAWWLPEEREQIYERERALGAAIQLAEVEGQKARSDQRSSASEAFRRASREAEEAKSPGLRAYEKELKLMRGR